MKQGRRSLLQSQVLLALHERPAVSITELAARIGAKRPSVSRSLSLLVDRGLVDHAAAPKWELTEAGRSQATAAEERLTDEMVRSIKAASRRYVTIKLKDGPTQRFAVSTRPESAIEDKVDVLRTCASDLAIDALRLFDDTATARLGVTALVDTNGDASFGALDAVRNLDLFDQRIPDLFAGIAQEYDGRIQDAMSGVLGLSSVRAMFADTDLITSVAADVRALTEVPAYPLASIVSDHFLSADIGALASMSASVCQGVSDLLRAPDPISMLRMNVAEGISTLGIASSAMAEQAQNALAQVSVGPMTSAISGLSELLGRSLAFDVSSVLGPIAATQDLYAGSLASIAEGLATRIDEATTHSLAAYPSAILDKIADDIIGIQRAELGAVGSNHMALSNVEWIGDRLEETALALSGAYVDRLSFDEYNKIAYGPEKYRELIAATTPVAYLTRGMRHYVEAEVNPTWEPSRRSPEPVELGNADLDAVLVRIHPDLPGMRRSAWQVLDCEHVQDRLSQAALSMRRMIKLILHQLVPEPSGTKLSFRDRFYKLMPNNPEEANVAASLFHTFNQFGDRIEMVIHVREIYRHESGLRSLMHAFEYMLEFMFSFGGVTERLDA